MNKVTMTEIRQATENYAEKARMVRNIKEKMQDAIRDIEKEHNQALIDAAKDAGEALQMVHTLLNSEGATDLFKKPKTINVNGVTVGFRKQIGSITVTNEQTTIELIREKMPDKMVSLINTEISVSKKALADLTADELKKIGVSVACDTDEPVVKIVDKDIQKMIDATIKDTMSAVA
jgi:uncharacterized protein YjiS (DUF1127 family)